jgi:hypothetical protein
MERPCLCIELVHVFDVDICDNCLIIEDLSRALFVQTDWLCVIVFIVVLCAGLFCLCEFISYCEFDYICEI